MSNDEFDGLTPQSDDTDQLPEIESFLDDTDLSPENQSLLDDNNLSLDSQAKDGFTNFLENIEVHTFKNNLDHLISSVFSDSPEEQESNEFMSDEFADTQFDDQSHQTDLNP
jgi:hypothetical protein